MSGVRSYKDLLVWQKAMDIAAPTYELTRTYPRDEFLRVSQGSLKELETHLLLAERVAVVEGGLIEPVLRDLDELGRMLRGLITALKAKRRSDPTP